MEFIKKQKQWFKKGSCTPYNKCNCGNFKSIIAKQCYQCSGRTPKGYLKESGKWALNFDKCIRCGTTVIEHTGKGLCVKCYVFKRYENIRKSKWDINDMCIRCGINNIELVRNGLCRKCHRLKNICIDCGKSITEGSKRCRVCLYKFMTGKKLSKKHRINLSKSKKRLIREGKLPNLFRKGKDNPMYGKKQPKKMIEKKRKAMKKLVKEGKLKTLFEEGHTPWLKGKTAKEDPRILSKEKHWNWKEGKSIEPYTFDFNETFKERIRKRDNHCCLTCNRMQEELGYKLSVHHIDYDKKNSLPQNCVSLCRQHHVDTNYNREHWKKFFQSLLTEKYNYEYTEDQKIILDFNL